MGPFIVLSFKLHIKDDLRILERGNISGFFNIKLGNIQLPIDMYLLLYLCLFTTSVLVPVFVRTSVFVPISLRTFYIYAYVSVSL